MELTFLCNWDVIDLLDLVNRISGGDRTHSAKAEFKLFCEEKCNNTGYLYFLDDDRLPIINNYLMSNFAYQRGEKIMFWLSW